MRIICKQPVAVSTDPVSAMPHFQFDTRALECYIYVEMCSSHVALSKLTQCIFRKKNVDQCLPASVGIAGDIDLVSLKMSGNFGHKIINCLGKSRRTCDGCRY